MLTQHTTTTDFYSRYKFNGKELDRETGYYTNWVFCFSIGINYGARYYEPSVSQWLSVDPLVAKYPAYSPYNYTLDNPIIYIDKDGKEGEWHWKGNNLVSDQYDNAQTLSNFLGISQSAANNILSNENFLTYSSNVSNGLAGTIVEGQEAYTIDRNTPIGSIIKLNPNINKYGTNHITLNINANGNTDTFHTEGRAASDNALMVTNWIFDVLSFGDGISQTGVGNAYQAKRLSNYSAPAQTDFTVTPDGVVVPNNQNLIKKGFKDAGFPKIPAEEASEDGYIYRIPTANGPVDARVMEGSAHYPKRTVITHPGTNIPKSPSGRTVRDKNLNHYTQH